MRTEPIRIAVLVAGGSINLQELIDAQQSGLLKSGRIALVVSSKADAYALTRAQNAGIPTAVASRAACGGQRETEAYIVKLLTQYRIELIVLAGYMSILSRDFTARYERRILNVHPALIPSFCGEGFYGLRVHAAALAKGVKVTGATVHFVNEIPDGGEFIMQKAVRVHDGDTPEKLQKRVMRQAEWKILPAATEKIAKEYLKTENG